uniref:Geranylgeranyl transferase type-2 subunit beta n=1 Tax=Pseudictyota dubia TaxID=2749911 RepID=A0A7R9WA00_9STRA
MASDRKVMDDNIANDEGREKPKSSGNATPFYDDLHVKYISTLATKLDSPTSYEGAVTEHLRMSGVYWSITALSLLRSPEEVDKMMGLTSQIRSNGAESSAKQRPSIVDWVFSCYDSLTGGFGGNVGHDGHLLYTLSALQILAIADMLDDPRLDREAVVKFVSELQQPDGSFAGDEWGEVDTRFSYCALSALSILGSLPERGEKGGVIDVRKAAQYVASCRNFDGGFGCVPGAESHAGQIFCCVGALSIAKSLDLMDVDLLSWWLAERQCDSGGLNGRPEKQADVCYSWWILSALSIMGRVPWISTVKLGEFILKCQDDDDGGIADRPSDMADVFHTFFGIAGLSLIGYLHDVGSTESDEEKSRKECYRKIDPVYALPTDTVQKLGLKAQVISHGIGEQNCAVIDDRLQIYDVLDGVNTNKK